MKGSNLETELMENLDLLSGSKKEINRCETNGNARKIASLEPPDGGVRACCIMLASFLTNGLLFGVINSYSVIYKELLKKLNSQGVENSETLTALVGALAMGITFLMSPVSGVLTGVLGLRLTAVLGGSIAALGLFLSSFAVSNVEALFFTFSLMYGFGASLAYTPSLAILGQYFKKYLGIVNGIVTVGSSVFTVIMPPLMDHISAKYGLEWMFRVLAILTCGIALCGLLFKPVALVAIEKPSCKEKNWKVLMKTIVNVQIWSNKKYMIWALSMPVALFGYFVPYVHMGKFIEVGVHFADNNQYLPLQCLSITSGVGRLLFGFLADRPGANRIMLQQISFYVIGLLTILLPFVTSYALLLVVALGMGLFDGAFIALIGPIAFELCGGACAAQAIGCMLGLASVPVSVGPPIAAAIYKSTQSYTLPFVLAGISPLIGATLMFLTRFGRGSAEICKVNGSTASKENGITGVERLSTLLKNEKDVA